MYYCHVNFEIKYLVKLKEIKASLQKDITDLDLVINDILLKNVNALDYISNQETLGVYDFRLCKASEEKVHFAISRLGKSNIEVIMKFLSILGEVRTGGELFELVEDGIQILLKNKILKEQILNGEANYFLYMKPKPERKIK
ncbi:hypothetical protein D7004_17990 [Pedobacter jejuensis]|uniref:Uncharacterized protein n=1 Tax=Pedobacter jejuensis TaxID=1268550 RepID=A0A3N0BMY1_9SPHI|nr:hypothetical protein D7004_17990 [Pedobacter jejuensis]